MIALECNLLFLRVQEQIQKASIFLFVLVQPWGLNSAPCIGHTIPIPMTTTRSGTTGLVICIWNDSCFECFQTRVLNMSGRFGWIYFVATVMIKTAPRKWIWSRMCTCVTVPWIDSFMCTCMHMCVQISTYIFNHVSLSAVFVIKSIPIISKVEEMDRGQFG